jgi:hypothetical protein
MRAFPFLRSPLEQDLELDEPVTETWSSAFVPPGGELHGTRTDTPTPRSQKLTSINR